MIKLTYNPEKYNVEIISQLDDLCWQETKELCAALCKDSYMKNILTIIIPWWQFLTIRQGLGYILRKYKSTMDIDNSLKQMLQDALQNNALYDAVKNKTHNANDSKTNLQEQLASKGFLRTLNDNQLRNVTHITQLNAAASFSVPGAGKTTEALAYYFMKKSEETKLIIIAPRNAFGAWEQEYYKCILGDNVDSINSSIFTRLRGGYDKIYSLLNDSPNMSIITYQQVHSVIDLLGAYMTKYECMLVLDESHRIKRGTKGKIGDAVLQISHLPKYKLILSGTPAPNMIEDIIPQFSFLYPEVRIQTEKITEIIEPIYVRTTKQDLKLPPRKLSYTDIDMLPAQRKLYKLLASELARQLEPNLSVIDRNELRKIGKSVMRLIQVASNPKLLSNSDFKDHPILKETILEGDCPKIDYVVNKARELATENKKVVIWTNFVQNVENLAFRLQDLGAEYIHGGVDTGSIDQVGSREYKINKFLTDTDSYVLVANPAAAAEGISLHSKCHYAIYMDRTFNAAQYLQSIDRIHRLGLPKDQLTFLEIVQCPETIDTIINERLEDKISNMEQLLNDNSINPGKVLFDEEVDYAEPEYNDAGLNELDYRAIISSVLEKAGE